jgi:hypothetical protein
MKEEQIDKLRHYKENEESYRALRAALTWNYEDFIPNRKISFLEIALEYVLSKTTLECYDVRFLCWLKTQYNLSVPIELNLPFICTPIQVKTEDFEKKYVFNETRKNLYDQLSQFIDYLKEQNNLASIDILFGGSYMDIENESPNDIDIAILIPEGEEENYNFNEASQRADKAIPEGVDMKFLPANLDLSSYKVYSRIVILGNKPKYKDSDPVGTDFKSNTFERSGITNIRL